MSSKTSIILTDDNEHWYTDCNEPINKEGEPYADAIILEFDKKNIRIEINDEDALVITLINPHSEIYNSILLLDRALKLDDFNKRKITSSNEKGSNI